MHPNQEVAMMMEGTAISSKPEAKEEIVDLTQISLRTLQLSDLDDLMVWTTDEKVTKFCTWEPHSSKDDGINFIENIATKFLWCKAICLNDRAIGCISLTSYSAHDKSRNKSAELGYVLGSKYWGKGIVTLVVKQAVKAIFSELPHLERIEALVNVENVGSQRVLVSKGREFLGSICSSREKAEIWSCSVFFSLIPKFDLFCLFGGCRFTVER